MNELQQVSIGYFQKSSVEVQLPEEVSGGCCRQPMFMCPQVADQHCGGVLLICQQSIYIVLLGNRNMHLGFTLDPSQDCPANILEVF